MANLATPFEAVPDGVRVRVRLTPRASADRIVGPTAEADGAVVLKATVTAVPEGGKANAALIKMLAKAWRLPKTSLAVIAGATDRRKTILVDGEPKALHDRLNAWAADAAGSATSKKRGT